MRRVRKGGEKKGSNNSISFTTVTETTSTNLNTIHDLAHYPRHHDAAVVGTFSFPIPNTSFISAPIVFKNEFRFSFTGTLAMAIGSASKSSTCMLTPSHSSSNKLGWFSTFVLVVTRSGESVTFAPGSLVSAILRDSKGLTTRRFFCLSAKIAFAPPGVGLGGLKGIGGDETGIGVRPNPPNPNASNLETKAARACLSFSNLTLV